ncbi:hypothetical protein ABG088_01465 [Hydrogenibacillus schlegelii]
MKRRRLMRPKPSANDGKEPTQVVLDRSLVCRRAGHPELFPVSSVAHAVLIPGVIRLNIHEEADADHENGRPTFGQNALIGFSKLHFLCASLFSSSPRRFPATRHALRAGSGIAPIAGGFRPQAAPTRRIRGIEGGKLKNEK